MITPTVGRKVWFWVNSEHTSDGKMLDERQAFDATVLYVHPTGEVNLLVVDHGGIPRFEEKVLLVDPEKGAWPTDQHDHAGERGYATWMPYQVGQAKKEEGDANKATTHGSLSPKVEGALAAPPPTPST